MYRSIVASTSRRNVFASRSLHTTPAAFKSVTETVKDTVKSANLKVGQTLAAGIEKGEEATETVKSTVGSKTEQTAKTAGHKADKAAAGAHEAKQDFKKHVKE